MLLLIHKGFQKTKVVVPMDIAALSVMMSQGQVQQQAGVSVMKMAMNVASTQGEMMTALLGETAKSLEMSVQPHLGGSVDIKV